MEINVYLPSDLFCSHFCLLSRHNENPVGFLSTIKKKGKRAGRSLFFRIERPDRCCRRDCVNRVSVCLLYACLYVANLTKSEKQIATPKTLPAGLSLSASLYLLVRTYLFLYYELYFYIYRCLSSFTNSSLVSYSLSLSLFLSVSLFLSIYLWSLYGLTRHTFDCECSWSFTDLPNE